MPEQPSLGDIKAGLTKGIGHERELSQKLVQVEDKAESGQNAMGTAKSLIEAGVNPDEVREVFGHINASIGHAAVIHEQSVASKQDSEEAVAAFNVLEGARNTDAQSVVALSSAQPRGIEEVIFAASEAIAICETVRAQLGRLSIDMAEVDKAVNAFGWLHDSAMIEQGECAQVIECAERFLGSL